MCRFGSLMNSVLERRENYGNGRLIMARMWSKMMPKKGKDEKDGPGRDLRIIIRTYQLL